MNSKLSAFLIFPFMFSVAISQMDEVVDSGRSGVVIENKVEVKAEGANAQTKGKVESKVNGQSVVVEIDQPGTLEVNNNNGKVEIKTQGNLTPKVNFSPTPFSEKLEENQVLPQPDTSKNQNFPQNSEKIFILVKTFLGKIFRFNWLKRWGFLTKT